MSYSEVVRPTHDPNGLPLTPHPDWDLVDPKYWKYFMLDREHDGLLNSTHSRLTPEEKRALFANVRRLYPPRCPAQYAIDSYPTGEHYKRVMNKGFLNANNTNGWLFFLRKLDPILARILSNSGQKLDTKEAVISFIQEQTNLYRLLLTERERLISDYYTSGTSQNEIRLRIKQITQELPAYESALTALKALLAEHEQRDAIFDFCKMWAEYNYAGDLL